MMVEMRADPALLKRIFEDHVPFNRLLGIHVDFMEKGKAVFSLPFREDLIGDPRRPAIHGGVISTLMDAVGGAAVWSELEEADLVSTVDLLVDYLQPGGQSKLIAEAVVIRIGNRVAVTQITVFQEGLKDPIASGRAVYNISRSRKTE
jgi:uncharacterized protein (TIGR00369 family)